MRKPSPAGESAPSPDRQVVRPAAAACSAFRRTAPPALSARPFSVLAARSIADLARGALELTVMVVMAQLIFGFNPAGGFIGTAVAMLLALAASWSLGWLFLASATWLRGSENVQTLGILVIMLLQFASNTFVPVASLPGYLRAVATVNPLSYGIDAARSLVLGRPVGSSVVVTLTTGLW